MRHLCAHPAGDSHRGEGLSDDEHHDGASPLPDLGRGRRRRAYAGVSPAIGWQPSERDGGHFSPAGITRDEPLRNDAANLVRLARFGMMMPNDTRLVGDDDQT